MKLTEKILVCIALLGIIFKIFLLPGGGLLIVISTGILSMLYFFLGLSIFNNIPLKKMFTEKTFENVSALKIVGSIGFGFSLSTLVIGIMFNIQFWAGATLMLITGLISSFLCFIIILIRSDENKTTFYKNVFIRTAIFGLFGLMMFSVPKMTLFEFFHRDQPAYVQAVRNLNADPTNKALQEELKKQWDLIHAKH